MEEKEVRIEKLNKLKEQGIDCYNNRFKPDYKAEDILNNFDNFENKKVKIAGRIISFRSHGKSAFAHLQDSSGKLQVYFNYNQLKDIKYKNISFLDIGDFLGVEGKIFKTKTGEITCVVEDYFILSKSILPLPEKWHGLKDVEIRFRKRYLDLIANKDVVDIFKTRSKIIKNIRKFLDEKGFLEVETPMLQSIPGGALAKPFITYHNTLEMNLYLRVAPELYLKRLLVGGFEKLYEINRNFRNEGISTWHNPEFTMLEVYQAYSDYEDIMNLTEDLIVHLVKDLFQNLKIKYGDDLIDFQPPFKRISYFEAIKNFSGIDLKNISFDELKVISKEFQIEEDLDKGEILEEIFKKQVEKNLIQPTFVYDFPIEISPLAKKREDDIVERFELYIGCREIANAFSELNDPIEQRERFKKQKKEKIDEDFLESLEHGMPPAGGLGIGIDRLVMILTNSSSIREVIFFPQMREEKK